jgi:hypothetical protein
MKNVLEFRKKRDFGDVITDSFRFLGIYAGPYFKTVGIIVGPVAVVAFVLISRHAVNFLTTIYINSITSQELPLVISSYGLLLIAYLLFYTASYDFIKVTVEKQGVAATIEEVWKAVKKDIFKILGVGLLFIVSLVLFVVVVVMLVSVMGSVSSFIFLPLLLYLAYAFIKFTLSMPAAVFDDLNAIDGMHKSWSFVKGNFWATFGISCVLLIIGFCVSLIIRIPIYVVQWTFSQHGVNTINEGWHALMTVVNVIAMIASMAAYILLVIGHSLQYLSIAEVREGKGLLHQIDELEIKTEEDSWGEEEY